jgi:PAS domain S-box-containing protein
MNLLVIDPHKKPRKDIVSLLHSLGHEGIPISTGEEALHILKESSETIEGIVSFLFLPHMDGYELCHQVRKIPHCESLPLVLYGPSLNTEVRTFAQVVGVDYCDLSLPQKECKELISQALTHPPKVRVLTDDAFYQQHAQRLSTILAAAVTKNAELFRELSLSSSRYTALFEGSHDAIIIFNKEEKCVDANEKACNLLGYSREDMHSLPLEDLFIPSDVPDISHKIHRLFSGEHRLIFERKLKSRKRTTVTVQIMASALSDASGTVSWVQMLCRDMSERKKVEAELTYRLIIEKTISQASRMLGSSGDLQYTEILELLCKVFAASHAFLVNLDRSFLQIETIYTWSDQPDERRYRSILETLDRASCRWWYETCEAGKNIVVHKLQDLPEEAETERTLFESHNIYSLVTVPILSIDGNLMGFMGIDDVNQCRTWDSEDAQALRIMADMMANYWERREVQKTLQEREEQYRNLFENSPIGIYRTTPDGRILMVNPALTHMLGYETAEELARRNLEKEGFEPEYPRNQFKEQLERDGQIIGLESAWVRNDGTTLYVRENSHIVRDETGRVLYYEGTVENITERKKAENQLKESEERYKSIFDLAPDGIITTDMKGIVTSCNTAFLQLTGFSREEILGTHFSKLPTIHLKDLPQIIKFFASIIKNKKAGPIEFHWLHNDGTVHMAEIHASIMKQNGKPIGIMGMARDITEQKHIQKKLRDSEEKYRTLMENLSVGVYRVTPGKEGQFIDVNQAFVRMLGYTSKEELLKLKVAEIYINPEDRIDFNNKISSQGFVKNEELHLKQKDGTPIIVSDTGTTVYDSDRNVLYYDGISEEITERKRIEEELQQYRQNLENLVTERTMALEKINTQLQKEISERKLVEESLAAEKEQLSVTLRSIGDGVITTDTEGRVLLINRVAEALTGWSMEEAIGTPLHTIFKIVNEKTRIPCENPVDKVLKQGAIVGLGNDTMLISRDGTERIIADSGAPIRDMNSKIIGVVLVFRDITEKQKMEQELLKTQKLESLGILAGGIAHDFNNILTAILTNVTLAKVIATDERTVEKLTTVEKATHQAKDLTQQLLTFSRGGAPIKKTTSIGELIRDTAGFALRGSNVKCRFSIPDDLWPVEIDEGQISQVINNLIINADQAMPEGGVLEISIENVTITPQQQISLTPGRYISISIRDQGVGIPQQHLQKVFDPYFTTKQKGSGLGLATTYSIIKHHNGHISVESQPGKGSTFIVWLPASGGEKRVEEESSPTPLSGKGTLLVMDDEDIILEAAGDVLEYLGYSVTFARNGKEAIDAYGRAMERGEPFDAVIMDLTIPGGLGGKETIQKLLDIDPHVSAVVSSGYSNDPVMANYRHYGFKGVVTKPYTVEELSRTLHKILSED